MEQFEPPAQSPSGSIDEPCPVCGGHDWISVYRLRDNRTGAFDGSFNVASCSGCRTIGVRPMPTQDELFGGYEQGYGPYPEPDGLEANALSLASVFLRRLWHMFDGNPTLDRFHLSGRVLDVGAGQGDNIEFLLRTGCQALGVEPNHRAVQVAHSRGLPVIQGTLDTVSLPEATFDAVVLSQVIEHLARPQQSLARVRRLLKPGGRLVITTPNPYGLQRYLFGRDWGHWHVPYHLHLFGPKQLARLLSGAGFKVCRLYTCSPAYWLRLSMRLRSHRSQEKGWVLAGPTQFGRVARVAIAPAMRLIDVIGKGDCLIALAEPL